MSRVSSRSSRISTTTAISWVCASIVLLNSVCGGPLESPSCVRSWMDEGIHSYCMTGGPFSVEWLNTTAEDECFDVEAWESGEFVQFFAPCPQLHSCVFAFVNGEFWNSACVADGSGKMASFPVSIGEEGKPKYDFGSSMKESDQFVVGVTCEELRKKGEICDQGPVKINGEVRMATICCCQNHSSCVDQFFDEERRNVIVYGDLKRIKPPPSSLIYPKFHATIYSPPPNDTTGNDTSNRSYPKPPTAPPSPEMSTGCPREAQRLDMRTGTRMYLLGSAYGLVTTTVIGTVLLVAYEHAIHSIALRAAAKKAKKAKKEKKRKSLANNV
uniref:ZP domain-containing protein n=1 Tax=Steinernema glaseri TaxID=37863 RepID=A0A1I7Z807_9BILA